MRIRRPPRRLPLASGGTGSAFATFGGGGSKSFVIFFVISSRHCWPAAALPSPAFWYASIRAASAPADAETAAAEPTATAAAETSTVDAANAPTDAVAAAEEAAAAEAHAREVALALARSARRGSQIEASVRFERLLRSGRPSSWR